MSSCISNISNIITNNLIDSTLNLVANSRLAYSISPLNSLVYTLFTEKSETIKFIIELASTLAINATITFYKFNRLNNSFVSIGSITVNENYTTFQKDLVQGDYFICIKINNNASYTGFITGEFSGFVPAARFTANSYYGISSTTNLTITKIERKCDYPLWYEIIEGTLPEGISFTNSGMLTGILPNLDCMESNHDLSPSANWYDDVSSGVSYPWGRAWRFKIKVYIQEFPDMALAEKWLCIRVYNNWDLEKNALLQALPLQHSYEIIVEPDPIVLPESLCPDKCVISEPIIEPIIEHCVDCLESVNTSIQMIKIPETIKLDVDNLLTWWVENNNLEFYSNEEIYFITSLRTSNIFQVLLKKTGVVKSIKNASEFYANTKITVTQVNNFIELRLSVLDNNRNLTDIDTRYLNSKREVNNNLELELFGFSFAFTSAFSLSS